MTDDAILKILLTVAVGCAGAFLAVRFKVAAGAMVGSMIAVVLLAGLTDAAQFPSWGRIFAQATAGAFIGVGLDAGKVRAMLRMGGTAVFLVVGIFGIALVASFSVRAVTGMPLLDALFAAAPGGMGNMTIVAQDMGADTALTVSYQLARLICSVTMMPLIIPRVVRLAGKNRRQEPAVPAGENIMAGAAAEGVFAAAGCALGSAPVQISGAAANEPAAAPAAPVKAPGFTRRFALEFSVTALVSAALGMLGNSIGFSAAIMIFPMLATAIIRVRWGFGVVPKPVKTAAQIASGIYIGCTMTSESLRSIGSNLLPMAGMVALYLALCLILGWLLNRIFKLDLATALFCATPAGAGDMALISSELGAQSEAVALMQTARLVCVTALYPLAVLLLV